MQQTESTTLGSQPGSTAQQIRKILQEWRNNGQKDSFEERTSAIRRVIELIDLAGLDDQEKQFFLGSMESLISNARSHDAKCSLSGLWIDKLEMPRRRARTAIQVPE